MKRETHLGMWAWLAQRASAIASLGLVLYHFYDPINARVQNLLMAFVLVHAVLGLRVILIDLGLTKWTR